MLSNIRPAALSAKLQPLTQTHASRAQTPVSQPVTVQPCRTAEDRAVRPTPPLPAKQTPKNSVKMGLTARSVTGAAKVVSWVPSLPP